MKIDDFKDELVRHIQKFFPDAIITIVEKRGIILETRVRFSENTFLEIYCNALTGKKSFTLITDDRRIFGYDNYKYWHLHPVENPSKHIPCIEPSIEEVCLNAKNILTKNND